MVAQLAKNFSSPYCVRNGACHVIEREMNHVVMMEFFVWQFFAEFQPDLVKQIDFFRCKPRCVARTKIKNLLPASRRKHFEGNARPWFLHSLPCNANRASLLRE